MRPYFYPRTVNGPYGDPGVYIPFLFENRAIIFDLGDNASLSAREILKVSHAFVTHTHMDHFIGFDRLLRLFLGREKKLHVFGPQNFLHNVEGKLSAYTWNLVESYESPFTLLATEIHPGGCRTREYLCQNGFLPYSDETESVFHPIIHEEPSFKIETSILDHRIPCLAFSIQERFHINIMKQRLDDMGLAKGPWLKEFKNALFSQQDPDSIFMATMKDGGYHAFVLKELSENIALITRGQKITYVTDVVYSQRNAESIIALAKDSDHLFIEATFLDTEKDIAKEKFHLTAGQAGYIAGKAKVKQYTLMHFSPRYYENDSQLYQEARTTYATITAPEKGE